ncbi:hypothetical protein K488DRAFT_8069, partial [Vararia minispora EC-137]
MTALHSALALRNQQAFQRLLDAAPRAPQPSSSAGHSWTKPSPLALASQLDVNTRDALGRTALHLACAAPDALEYVRLLLAHPAVNVNVLDAESHWSALHRALYAGNVAVAILLLQRPDTDTSIADLEGNTPFDLYNSTVHGTAPDPGASAARRELLTWGTNRNATLGHADGDDRTYPDVVPLPRSERAGGSAAFRGTIAFRLRGAGALDVRMARLHTVVVTDEPQGNVRLCGFASTGRLGSAAGHVTQYRLSQVQNFEHTVVAVALGQDHTLALTDAGIVLSWGFNRFAQLGYVVDAPEQVQASPRAIMGPLRRERVVGVAACKTASACWTAGVLYTWGKNGGQLGYDSAAQPAQVLPRIVTKVTKPVLSVAMTDSSMAVLQNTSDVLLLVSDTHIRVNFPSESITTSAFHTYRPPHAAASMKIEKLVCSDALFAAVSAAGDLFTFTTPTSISATADAKSSVRADTKPSVRPQRVSALRKHWGPVRDAALGADGSIVVCTAHGHVYARGAKGAGKGAFKFQRVPLLQRAVAVRANETGAMAAIRVDFRPEPIEVSGNDLARDVASVRPWLVFERVEDRGRYFEPGEVRAAPPWEAVRERVCELQDDDEQDETPVGDDVVAIAQMLDLLAQVRATRRGVGVGGIAGASVGAAEAGLYNAPFAHGADILVRAGKVEFPAHVLVLAARCPALCGILGGTVRELRELSGGAREPGAGTIVVRFEPAADHIPHSADPAHLPCLAIVNAHPLAVLILTHYFYADTLPALGDARVARALAPELREVGASAGSVVRELQRLARTLGLEDVAQAAGWASKVPAPPTLARDMRALAAAAQASPPAPLRGDVLLGLADRDVRCHSVVLRARSPVFAAMFDDDVWTRERWGADGVLEVDWTHVPPRAMGFVLRFLCGGEEGEMFERLDSVESVDQCLDLLFEVMYTANELLLDRLLLVCASLVLKYVSPHNLAAIYSDAADLPCTPLRARLADYAAATLETLLDGRLLDDLAPRVVRALGEAIRERQADKSPHARGSGVQREADARAERHREWLESEDFPVPIIRGEHRTSPRRARTGRTSLPASPAVSPAMRPGMPSISGAGEQLGAGADDLFVMDDAGGSARGSGSGGPWKGRAAPQRIDMKAIFAETEAEQQRLAAPAPGIYRPPSKDGLRPPSAAAPVGIPTARASPGVTPVNTPPRTNAAPRIATTPPRTGTPRATAGTAIAAPAWSPTAPAKPSGISTSRPAPAPTPPKPVPASSHAGLGPTITPSKRAEPLARTPSGPGARAAWTLRPVQPVVQTAAASPLPFAEIQRLQREATSAAPRDKRSLREIQDEERRRAEEERELEVEVEFLRWWAEEEERVRREAGGAAVEGGAGRAQGQRRRSGKREKRDEGVGQAAEKNGGDARERKAGDGAHRKAVGEDGAARRDGGEGGAPR